MAEIKVKAIIKDVDAIKNFAEEYNSYEDAKKVRIKIGIFLFQMIDSITTNQDTIEECIGYCNEMNNFAEQNVGVHTEMSNKRKSIYTHCQRSIKKKEKILKQLNYS